MDLEATSLYSTLLFSAKRAQESCAPYRARKVKYNRAALCARYNVIKSDYPEFCLYDSESESPLLLLRQSSLLDRALMHNIMILIELYKS